MKDKLYRLSQLSCLISIVLQGHNLAHAQEWSTSGTVIYSANTGNGGIGTTSPSAKLEVNGNVVSGGLDVRQVLSYFGTSAGGTRLHATGGGSAGIWLRYTDNNMYIDADLHTLFRVNGQSSPVEAMRITNAGYVGIGTVTPSSTLHVVGNVTVDGNIGAKYQDIAEWVPSTQVITPGTVVILDPSRTNSVMASGEAYDMRVAGVVSSSPGIVLGEAGEDKVKVATTGRVKVRVDATRTPIRIGDPLVTSDREGFAMRSEPVEFGPVSIHRPGTLIGKALESITEGEGEILVLLSLQ